MELLTQNDLYCNIPKFSIFFVKHPITVCNQLNVHVKTFVLRNFVGTPS